MRNVPRRKTNQIVSGEKQMQSFELEIKELMESMQKANEQLAEMQKTATAIRKKYAKKK
jgi:septal ring factor EnvC (AmiA/AmiB activator)